MYWVYCGLRQGEREAALGSHVNVNHAKNATAACFSVFLAQYSRSWQWTVNPGDMPWHRRLAWSFYLRILVLGMGMFQARVEYIDSIL